MLTPRLISLSTTSLLLLLLSANGACAFVVRGTVRVSVPSSNGACAFAVVGTGSTSVPSSSSRSLGTLSSQATTVEKEPDFGEVAKYFVATGIQFSLLSGLLRLIDWVAMRANVGKLPLPVVGLLFAFFSLRSRVASVLDNSRPNVEAQGGKATPNDVKRPSWTPPGVAFPIIWLSITLLRAISSALVYRETGALFSIPLMSMILHLSIGDTWNTITNVEKRLGVSAIGCVAVWLSVWNVIVRYYNVLPIAGKILSPSGVWISVATVLTMSIWRMNKPVQAAWPVKGDDGNSAAFKWSNLLQLQATSIGGSSSSTSSSADEGRMNMKIDLDSAKVVTVDKLETGKKVYCRCWASGTFPLCDGSHMKHNEKTGDNVGPIIVSAAKGE